MSRERLPADRTQVVLVTGAGRGIGRAIADLFVREGARVAYVARTAQDVVQAARAADPEGRRTLALSADVAEAGAPQQILAAVERKFGFVTLLVNNAGVAGPVGPFWESDLSEWRRAFEINFHATASLCHAVLPRMIMARRGRIINVASDAALGPFAHASAYGTSKTALVRFTEALAVELRHTPVRIFAIHPGVIRTGMNESSLASADVQRFLPDFCRIFEQHRDVRPDGAVNLVARLASGSYDRLSGRYLAYDDNLDQLVARSDEPNLRTLRLQG